MVVFPRMEPDRDVPREDFEHTEDHPPRWRKRLIVALMILVTASIVGRAYVGQPTRGAGEAQEKTGTPQMGPSGLVPTDPGATPEDAEKKTEPSTTEKLLPFVTEGGLAMLLGIALGMATRAVAKIAVILLAITFVAIQYLSYKGMLTMDWGQFGEWLNNLVLNVSGENGLGAIMKHKLPSAGALGVGYYLGLKKG